MNTIANGRYSYRELQHKDTTADRDYSYRSRISQHIYTTFDGRYWYKTLLHVDTTADKQALLV